MHGDAHQSRETTHALLYWLVSATLFTFLVSHPGGWAMRDGARSRHVARGWVGRSAARRRSWIGGPPPRGPDDGPDQPDDLDQVVERARAGEAEAFGELFDRFHGLVFRQLFAQTRSRALAEDLTSETFFRALRAVSVVRAPEPALRTLAAADRAQPGS